MIEYQMTLNFENGHEAQAARFAYSAESAVRSFMLEAQMDRPEIGKMTSAVVIWTA